MLLRTLKLGGETGVGGGELRDGCSMLFRFLELSNEGGVGGGEGCVGDGEVGVGGSEVLEELRVLLQLLDSGLQLLDLHTKLLLLVFRKGQLGDETEDTFGISLDASGSEREAAAPQGLVVVGKLAPRRGQEVGPDCVVAHERELASESCRESVHFRLVAEEKGSSKLAFLHPESFDLVISLGELGLLSEVEAPQSLQIFTVENIQEDADFGCDDVSGSEAKREDGDEDGQNEVTGEGRHHGRRGSGGRDGAGGGGGERRRDWHLHDRCFNHDRLCDHAGGLWRAPVHREGGEGDSPHDDSGEGHCEDGVEGDG